jgi:hypothetical protein
MKTDVGKIPGFSAEASLGNMLNTYNGSPIDNAFIVTEIVFPAKKPECYMCCPHCGPCQYPSYRKQCIDDECFKYSLPCTNIAYPTKWICNESGSCCRLLSPHLTQCQGPPLT